MWVSWGRAAGEWVSEMTIVILIIIIITTRGRWRIFVVREYCSHHPLRYKSIVCECVCVCRVYHHCTLTFISFGAVTSGSSLQVVRPACHCSNYVEIIGASSSSSLSQQSVTGTFGFDSRHYTYRTVL